MNYYLPSRGFRAISPKESKHLNYIRILASTFLIITMLALLLLSAMPAGAATTDPPNAVSGFAVAGYITCTNGGRVSTVTVGGQKAQVNPSNGYYYAFLLGGARYVSIYVNNKWAAARYMDDATWLSMRLRC